MVWFKRILQNERGFTLVELMVVVVIIGILTAIAVPAMGKQVDKAKVKRAVAEVKAMKTAVDTYKMEKSVCPKTNEVKNALEDFGITSFNDPWENSYVYATKDTDLQAYELVSGGPDGNIGSGDDDIGATNAANPTENFTSNSALTDTRNLANSSVINP